MNICFFAKTEEKYEKKISYIVDLFFSTYGLDYRAIKSADQLKRTDFPRPDLILFYGNQDDYRRLKEEAPLGCHFLLVSSLFSQVFEPTPPEVKRLKKKGTDYSIPILYSFPAPEQECLYAIEEKSGRQYPGIVIAKNEGKTEIACYADLFASSFYWLTLQEEKDQDRFKARGSWREREGLHRIPPVNHYFKLLFDLVQLVAEKERIPLLYKGFWPSDSNLAVALTHDVDILAQWIPYLVFRKWTLLRKGRFTALTKMILRLPGFLFKKNKSLYGVNLFLAEERSRGYNSTFFFLAGAPSFKATLKSDITYSIRKAEPAIQRILENQGEIGLHGSRKSYLSQEVMRAEKENLDRFLPYPCIGTRQHFLCLKKPSTWKYQSQTGFLYDCTLGYPDRSGFRSGFAFPFQPFESQADKKIDIWEINTNVMDQTYDKYDPKTIDQIKEEIDRLFLQLESSGGGMLTLLWHTNVLEEFGFLGFVKLYGEVLESLKTKNAFVSTGENIVKYWKARNEIRLLERKVEKDLWQWKFQAVSPIKDLTFCMKQPREGRYRIQVDGVNASIKTEYPEARIILPRIESNQSFRIILTSEGA